MGHLVSLLLDRPVENFHNSCYKTFLQNKTVEADGWFPNKTFYNLEGNIANSHTSGIWSKSFLINSDKDEWGTHCVSDSEGNVSPANNIMSAKTFDANGLSDWGQFFFKHFYEKIYGSLAWCSTNLPCPIEHQIDKIIQSEIKRRPKLVAFRKLSTLVMKDIDEQRRKAKSVSENEHRITPTTHITGVLRNSNGLTADKEVLFNYNYSRWNDKDEFYSDCPLWELLEVMGSNFEVTVEHLDEKRLFFNNLPFLLNNAYGEIFWNGVSILCTYHPEHRVKFLDYDLEPTRLYLEVDEEQEKLAVYRNANELKIVTTNRSTKGQKRFVIRSSALQFIQCNGIVNGHMSIQLPDNIM